MSGICCFFNPGVTSKNTDKHNDELDLFTNMFTTARSWEPDIHGELVSNGGYGGKTTAQKKVNKDKVVFG